jgi:adenylate kinase
MTIIFYGPPGVGKGTQAQLTMSYFGMAHISTGNLLREEIQRKSELGLRVEDTLRRGQLVSDDIVNQIVKKKISEEFPGTTEFLFDGYPRTVTQAKALDEVLSDFGLDIVCVLNLFADRTELLRRLTGRRTCRRCGATYHVHLNKSRIDGVCDVCGGQLFQRTDDNEESVSKRLDTFEKQTRPLLAYYKDQGLMVEIDGAGQIYEVQERIRSAIENLQRD